MCRANNVMIVQTSQLGQIEELKDKVHVLEDNIVVQDNIISNLVSDNLDTSRRT